jgi:hypothetical protein
MNGRADEGQVHSSGSAREPIRVPQNPLAFHPLAQRNAFRRRDVRRQRRLFVRENPRLRRSPKSNRLLLRLSAMISLYFTRAPETRPKAPFGASSESTSG